MTSIHMISIGDQLLNGSIHDTNINWLCKRLTPLGGIVERAVLVRYDRGSIMFEVRHGLLAAVRLLITTGGMGPTADDLTLYSIGKATHRPLVLNSEAMRMVEERYAYLAKQGHFDNGAITPAREKMAKLPEGASPIYNPVGVAPAMVLKTRVTTILSLPGTPNELQEIFNGPIQPTLSQIFGEST